MTENLLLDFIGKRSYDIRKTGNGRWIDQKCTPDEVSFVAECVLAYAQETGREAFQSPDIWRNEFSVQKVQEFFGKPDPLNPSALDEYNKFFRQPLKMLAASGVLSEAGKIDNTIQFKIVNKDILAFLSRNSWNAYVFLYNYIEKTLRDSGIWDEFATFLELQTAESFNGLKKAFAEFCKQYTPINTHVEANRIFAKVLNPLACRYHKRGTLHGRLSPQNIAFSALSYNRENWRDIGKPKYVARRDVSTIKGVPSQEYFSSKAKAEVRSFNKLFNGGASEVLGKHSSGEATQMHHIFPQHDFPDIAAFVENIIALTPTQHFTLAHPKNHTAEICKDFQYSCLLSKNESIAKNVCHGFGTPGFYSFDKFMFMLDVGFDADYFQSVPRDDFMSVRKGIDAHFE